MMVPLKEGPVHDYCVLCLVKQVFDGEIVDRPFRDEWPRDLQIDYDKVPEEIFVSPVRSVLQEYYCRGKPRSKRFNNPDQGVLNL